MKTMKVKILHFQTVLINTTLKKKYIKLAIPSSWEIQKNWEELERIETFDVVASAVTANGTYQ